MTNNSTNIKTENDVLLEIVEWSKTRPPWQRDALRRLVINGKLSQVDLKELAQICKDVNSEYDPLDANHFNSQKSNILNVSLRSIKDVENVNALPKNQSLKFIPRGVNIVYGNNGAGKSGYVRILKQVCRSRIINKEDKLIHSNIYNESKGEKSATIEYFLGENNKEVHKWKDGEIEASDLSAISVFDSRTANVHVEEKNDLAYKPYPIKLLEHLAEACNNIKKIIDDENTTIKEQTPEILVTLNYDKETEAGELLTNLSHETNPDDIERLANLEVNEENRRNELLNDFRDGTDAKAKAEKIPLHKNKLINLSRQLIALDKAISDENAKNIKDLFDDLELKNQVAIRAAQSFSNEPLKGVGDEIWQRLWEAAREYSNKLAYPGEYFPMRQEGSLCVLCHQELDKDAVDRFSSFENFIQDKAQKDKEAAEIELDVSLKELHKSICHVRDLPEIRYLLNNEVKCDKLFSDIRLFIIQAKCRLKNIVGNKEYSNLPIPLFENTRLEEAIENLEKRYQALLTDDGSDERKAIYLELSELNDRKLLATIKNDVFAEIERKEKIEIRATALEDTNSKAITDKNTEFSKSLVTEKLQARFNQELNDIGLSNFAIELKQVSSSVGVVHFKIGFRSNSKLKDIGNILSEGEFRCIALCGFLAELATSDSESGIIFDDPVSSLDHLHREKIAERLAKEGRKRQVIIFTHDLPFLFLLEYHCKKANNLNSQTEVTLRSIQQKDGEPGYCFNKPPHKAKNIKEILESTRKHLNNTRRHYDENPEGSDWIKDACGMLDILRQAWEKAIEDIIAPVIQTFSSKVNNKEFYKLSAITKEDAVVMRRHYGEISITLHKASDKLNPIGPVPNFISQEIEALEEWYKSLIQRQSNIGKLAENQ